MCALFHGHSDLLRGFLDFIPQECRALGEERIQRANDSLGGGTAARAAKRAAAAAAAAPGRSPRSRAPAGVREGSGSDEEPAGEHGGGGSGEEPAPKRTTQPAPSRPPILFPTPAPTPLDVFLGSFALPAARDWERLPLAPFAACAPPSPTSVHLLGEKQPRFSHVLVGAAGFQALRDADPVCRALRLFRGAS